MNFEEWFEDFWLSGSPESIGLKDIARLAWIASENVCVERQGGEAVELRNIEEFLDEQEIPRMRGIAQYTVYGRVTLLVEKLEDGKMLFSRRSKVAEQVEKWIEENTSGDKSTVNIITALDALGLLGITCR